MHTSTLLESHVNKKPTPEIKYLAFAGGGAAGCAYAGVLEALASEPSFDFNNLEAVAGTSIGSVVALMVALKYTPEEAKNLFEELELKKLADSTDPIGDFIRYAFHYGIYKGEELDKLIKHIIKQKIERIDPNIKPEDVTFEFLKQHGFLDLYVVACKAVNDKDLQPSEKQKIFCLEKTAKTSVAAAVRASAAPPKTFTCVRLKKVEHEKYVVDKNGHPFIDGGFLNNFPIEIFDDPKFMVKDNVEGKFNPHTLGVAFKMASKEELLKSKIVTSLLNQVPAWIRGMLDELHIRQMKLEDSFNSNRVILVDRLGVKLDDFFISKSKVEDLVASGREAVKTYFNRKKRSEPLFEKSSLFSKSEATNALYDAIEHNDLQGVKNAMDSGANVNAHRTYANVTPLHRAVLRGNFKIVRYLIQNGADKNTKLADKTPAQLADEIGYNEIKEYLELNQHKKTLIDSIYSNLKVIISIREAKPCSPLSIERLFMNFEPLIDVFIENNDHEIISIRDPHHIVKFPRPDYEPPVCHTFYTLNVSKILAHYQEIEKFKEFEKFKIFPSEKLDEFYSYDKFIFDILDAAGLFYSLSTKRNKIDRFTLSKLITSAKAQELKNYPEISSFAKLEVVVPDSPILNTL